jgi:hypothetical protein
VVALPTTAGGYAYSNGSAVLFGGSAAHKVEVLQQPDFCNFVRFIIATLQFQKLASPDTCSMLSEPCVSMPVS